MYICQQDNVTRNESEALASEALSSEVLLVCITRRFCSYDIWTGLNIRKSMTCHCRPCLSLYISLFMFCRSLASLLSDIFQGKLRKGTRRPRFSHRLIYMGKCEADKSTGVLGCFFFFRDDFISSHQKLFESFLLLLSGTNRGRLRFSLERGDWHAGLTEGGISKLLRFLSLSMLLCVCVCFVFVLSFACILFVLRFVLFEQWTMIARSCFSFWYGDVFFFF